MNIGGNIYATLQTKTVTKNQIGESVETWEDDIKMYGWLDLSSGDSKHTTFNAKIQESTHIFLCDYQTLGDALTVDNCRMVVNGCIYEVLLIDNPMEMNEQLEFYLKYTGGIEDGS